MKVFVFSKRYFRSAILHYIAPEFTLIYLLEYILEHIANKKVTCINSSTKIRNILKK